jgi:hypothetical protein
MNHRISKVLAHLVIGKANLCLSETQRGKKRTMEISGTNNSGRKIFIVVNLD